ncbi:hypothetical protein HDV05_004412 [Chytridiales sp. JEL 0842]|nr:hypothetical protein HDV05_004412 [Chytridiales sp. JEL 0842]
MAYSVTATDVVPPSVTYLAAYLSYGSTSNMSKMIQLISNSQLMLSASVLMINIRPLITTNIVTQYQIDTVTANYLSEILKLHFRFVRSTVRIIAMGADAEQSIRECLSSLPKELTESQKIKFQLMRHPVAISRAQIETGELQHYEDTLQLPMVEYRLSPNSGRLNPLSMIKRTVSRDVCVSYNVKQVLMLSNSDLRKTLSKIFAACNIERLIESFATHVNDNRQLIPALIVAMRRDKREDELSNTVDYNYRVFETVLTNSKALMGENLELRAEVQRLVEKVDDGEDKEALKDLVVALSKLVATCTKYMAMTQAMIASAYAAEPAIPINTGRIAPLVSHSREVHERSVHKASGSQTPPVTSSLRPKLSRGELIFERMRSRQEAADTDNSRVAASAPVTRAASPIPSDELPVEDSHSVAPTVHQQHRHRSPSISGTTSSSGGLPAGYKRLRPMSRGSANKAIGDDNKQPTRYASAARTATNESRPRSTTPARSNYDSDENAPASVVLDSPPSSRNKLSVDQEPSRGGLGMNFGPALSTEAMKRLVSGMTQRMKAKNGN